MVDLCGKKDIKRLEKYSKDSINVVFSSGKTIVAFVVAWLVDQGRLKYEEKVSTYWPQFAQNGKEDILVEEVMRHESGLAFLDVKITREMMKPENYATLREAFETSKPAWLTSKSVEKGDRIYHATTRGYLIDELCRRVDEEKRSLSQLILHLSQKVSAALGNKEVSTFLGGFDEVNQQKIVLHTFKNPIRNQIFLLALLAFPCLQDRPEGRNNLPDSMIARNKEIFQEAKRKKKRPQGIKAYFGTYDGLFKNPTLESMNFEGGSFNITSNAVSLAAFGQAFVLEGSDKRLLSDDALALMLSEPTQKLDMNPFDPTTFTKGGHGCFREALFPSHLHSFYGWQGYGGSVFAFSPEYELSVSYVPNQKRVTSFGGFLDERCLSIMEALMDVVDPKLRKRSL